MFYFIGVVIIALITALAGCSKTDDPNPDGPNDTIHNPPGPDSVVIAISLSLPSCITLVSTEIKFWHPALPNGGFDQWYAGDNRFFRYVYKDKNLVAAMVGTECSFYPILEGGCNGNPSSLYMPGGTQVITLHKGVNPVTLEYAMR